MVNRYTPGSEGLHGGLPDRQIASTSLVVMPEACHYCHLRITLRPEEQRWDLEAVSSMISEPDLCRLGPLPCHWTSPTL